MWRDALLICGKDLRIELRSKIAINQVAPFALVVLVLFGLALGPDPSHIEPVAAGLFWIAVLLSAVLSVQRSFVIESGNDAKDGLRLLGLDPGGVFLGKAVAIALELLVLEVLLAIVAALLYGIALQGVVILVAVCIVATAGLAAVGTLYGAVASSARAKETLLPLLFFPVVAPVVLGATKAWNEALSGHGSGGLGWLGLLAVFAAFYLAIGSVTFGALMEDA